MMCMRLLRVGTENCLHGCCQCAIMGGAYRETLHLWLSSHLDPTCTAFNHSQPCLQCKQHVVMRLKTCLDLPAAMFCRPGTVLRSSASSRMWTPLPHSSRAWLAALSQVQIAPRSNGVMILQLQLTAFFWWLLFWACKATGSCAWW